MDFIDDSDDSKVTIVTKKKKYWSAESKSITAETDVATEKCNFMIEWKNTKITFKANNGKYITSSSGGQLSATGSNNSEENSQFIFELINRPILVLRCEHGYIGLSGNAKIHCNRGTDDAIHVENVSGKYRLKMANGKAWKANDSGTISLASGEGDLFLFMLCGKNQMKIQTVDGKYLIGDLIGPIMVGGTDKSFVWEY